MTLYQQVKQYLLAEIEKNKEDTVLPSQNYLVRRFNVCHLTVRKALDELEQQGLIYRIQGKGTFVRKKNHLNSSIQILVVVRSNWKKDFSISAPFMEKFVDESLQRNFQLHIFPLRKNHHEIFRNIDLKKFAGCIWLVPWEKDVPAMEEIFKNGIPVMAINRIFPVSKFSYVSTDHQAGAYKATQYLLKKGHKKIGFAGYIEASHIMQRYNGFYNACIESGVYPAKKDVVKMVFEGSDVDWQKSQKDFFNMLSFCNPKAIFVSGIAVLLNVVLPVLRAEGMRIPDDIEIVTFDEIPDDVEEKKSIHEIIQPFAEMSKIAIEKIEDIVKGKAGITRIAIEPEFVIKEKVVLEIEK